MARGAGGGGGSSEEEMQGEEARAAHAGSNVAHGEDGSGGGGDGVGGDNGVDMVVAWGTGERVVRRGNGERVEEWSERRRGKRRVHESTLVAPSAASSRKMPKGGIAVRWTAVARDAYVERQRQYERGEGGGVT